MGGSCPAPSSTTHRSQEALTDFQLALALLRDNTTIDYRQLGLSFKLQAWEVSICPCDRGPRWSF